MTADFYHSTGSAPEHRRPSFGPIIRSLSFHSLPIAISGHGNEIWHAKSLPLDIPGTSLSHHHPKRRHRYLASASVPVNGDAVPSRSLLEQCRMESDAGSNSARSSLRQPGSWTVFSVGAGTDTARTSLSTWKPPSVPSSASVSSCDSWNGSRKKLGVGFTAPGVNFTKKKPIAKHVQRQTSALSAALRGCYVDRDGSSAPDVIEAPQIQICTKAKSSLLEDCDIPESCHDDLEAEVREVVPIPTLLPLRTGNASSPSSDSSWTTSATDDCPSLTDAGSLAPVSQAEQRRALLEILIERIYAKLAPNHAQGDEAGQKSFTPSSTSSTQSKSGQAARKLRTTGQGKRRPSQNDSDGSGDSDDDEEKHKRPVSKRSKHKQTGKRMLACPFFKRNPQRYQRERSCVGPGWETMHRLKEHLYRCHTLPIHCLRCHGVFPSEEGLRVHSLSDTPCQRREAGDHAEDPLEGIGLSQERQLRSRKRTTKTEEDKWKDAYKICFPDDTLMPSPYYEIPVLSESATSGSSELTQYEDFVQSELPRRVRSALNKWLDREMIPLEERLRPQLADMVRDIQLSLLEEFRTQNLGGESASAGTSSVLASPPSTAHADGVHNSPEEFDGVFSNELGFIDLPVLDTTTDASPAHMRPRLAGDSVSYKPKEPHRMAESPKHPLNLPSEMPFFEGWEQDQTEESVFFLQDGGPIDTSWTGLDGDFGGSGPGVEDWATCWGSKAYVPRLSGSILPENGSQYWKPDSN